MSSRRIPMPSPARHLPRRVAHRMAAQMAHLQALAEEEAQDAARPRARAHRKKRAQGRTRVVVSPQLLRVEKGSDGWALRVDDLDEPAWVVSNKKRAVAWAQDAARYHGCTLEVFKADGELHKRQAYGA